MNAVAIIMGMALLTYGTRLAGLALVDVAVPAFWLRFLRFVPVAVFAALVAPALPGDRGEWPVRLIAAVIAGIATWWTRKLWVGILTGMACFWLLRLL